MADGPAPQAVAADTCFHCGAALSATALQSADFAPNQQFCCSGCLSVAQTIVQGGLADYYQFVTRNQQPIGTLEPALGSFDLQPFIDYHGSQARLVLSLPALHCAACIWLIERVLAPFQTHPLQTPQAGLVQINTINVNLARRELSLSWVADGARTLPPWQQWLDALARIGYNATPVTVSQQQLAKARTDRKELLRCAIALLAMMQVMMLAWPSYSANDISRAELSLLQGASLLMTLPVLFYSAWPIIQRAFYAARARHINMDVTVATALLLALAASVWNHASQAGDTYYDSITMFVALFLSARLIERWLQRRADADLTRLARSMPQRVAIAPQFETQGTDSPTQTLPTLSLATGMVVRLQQSELVMVDGLVLAGHSSVTEAQLSGESLPISKQAGDLIWAGSYNVSDTLWVKVQATYPQSRYSRLLQQAQAALQVSPNNWLDRLARHYLLFVLLATVVVGAVWFVLAPERTLQIMIAMLIVACPCALSIAYPATRAAAAAHLARRGILTLKSDAFDTLPQITDIVFDKTGTLSTGKLQWQRTVPLAAIDTEQCGQWACALEAHSAHPLAHALRQRYETSATLALGQIQQVIGAGVCAPIKDSEQSLRLGHWGFVTAPLAPTAALAAQQKQWQSACQPNEYVLFLGNGQQLLAYFVFSDPPREQTLTILNQLRHYRLHLLSGDRVASVNWWGQQWGLSAQGGCSPEKKAAYIDDLQQQGAKVLALGDGVNDVLMLARAGASIAVSSEFAQVQAHAGFASTRHSLAVLPYVLSVGQQVRRITRQNLGWALLYNALTLPLAAFGEMTPLIAGIGMSLSSLLVGLNAARLTVYRASLAGAEATKATHS